MKYEMLERRIEIVKKVVEEENDLSLGITDDELAQLFDDGKEIITSSDLKIGDIKNIIFFESFKAINDMELVKLIRPCIDKNQYNQFQIIVLVHSVKEKIHISEFLDKECEKLKNEKKLTKAAIKWEVYFVGIAGETDIHIAIDSAIRINKNIHEKNGVEGRVYNAKLSDLVKLYDKLGDDLFKDNVREKIENILDVDTEIKNTLRNQPENFWFFNNGITLLVESERIKQCREYQLDIKISNNCDVSVINGAQTISVAAMYFLSLFETLENTSLSGIERAELEEKKKQALEAKVLLRVIKRESYREELIDFYKNISISLNRQKAINDADIRYTDYLIEDINSISEKKKEPFFRIQKRSINKQRRSRGEYKIEDFVKIAAIYLLQEPGTARSSKGKYLRMDSQWERLKVSKNEEFDEKIFLKKYKPFVITAKLFHELNKNMNLSAKECNSIELLNTYKYGTEFLTSYIVWVANKKQIEDFSSFPDELIWDDKLVEIVKNEFAKAVMVCFKSEEIDSNLFKKDKAYLELRNYLSKLLVLDNAILKLFGDEKSVNGD